MNRRADADLRDYVRQLEARLERLEARLELGPRALEWDALVFVTAAEACEKLGVSQECLRGWIRRGLLPALRLGRTVRIPAWWLAARVAAPAEVRVQLLERVVRASSRKVVRSAAADLQDRAQRLLDGDGGPG